VSHIKPVGLLATVAVLAGSGAALAAAGATIRVSVGGGEVTVIGSTGGAVGAVGQIFFSPKTFCASFTELSGDPKVTGDVIAKESFTARFSVKSLTSGSPKTRSVCAFIIAPNDQGTLAPIASSAGELPNSTGKHHQKHHHKHHKKHHHK
jgi:hypothetical protein